MTESDVQLKRLAERVGRHLLKARHHAATAESCTGGWIAKAMTDIAGSSQWFVEGFVTYSNESKAQRLGVPRAVLETVRELRRRWPNSHLAVGLSNVSFNMPRRGLLKHVYLAMLVAVGVDSVICDPCGSS